MEWRCEWCGKPHEEDDPPCDECGHHKFEKAVVPVAPENPDHEPEPVWVCPECGREHQRNAPPCSRCGNPSLEQRRPDYAALDEIGSTSYFDLLSPGYVAALAVALVAGAVLVLALAGVITLPGMADGSLAVADVPGEANVSNGISLSAAETAYAERYNERRASAGEPELTRNGRLDEVARYVNQRGVKAEYGDGEPADGDRIREASAEVCENTPTVLRGAVDREGAIDSYGSERELGAALADAVENETVREPAPAGAIGVDLHVGPDGRVFATTIVC